MYRLAVFARKLAGVLQRRLRGTLLAGRAVAPFQPWRLYPAGNTVFLGSGHWEAPDNPQLLMFPPRDAWRAGLHQIRFRGAPQQDAKLHPRLYFDIGDGFEEAHTHQFPALGAEDQVFYVNIPAKTRAIRIDPLAQPARFPLHDVSLRKVSALRLALHIAQRKDTHRRHAFRALFLKRDYREALRIIAPSDNYAAADSTNYQRWLSEYEPSAGSDATRAQAHLQTLPTRPLISIVMPAYQSNIAWLKAAIDSVRAQYYADWELIVVDDASPDPDVSDFLRNCCDQDERIKTARRAANGGIAAATDDAIAMSKGAWIAFMDHDDVITPDALALIVDAMNAEPKAAIIYTDEDKIDDADRRSEPYFKGAWNRELFYAQNYLNHLSVVRRDVIAAAGGMRPEFDGSQDHDLLLRCIEHIDDAQIVHVPFVCYHWRFATQRVNFSQRQVARSQDSARRALEEHFARTGLPAISAAAPSTPYRRAKWRIPNPQPLVSIIIPTRDRVDLLAQALDSIFAAKGYAAYEVLIADNDSSDPETLVYFRRLTETGAARIIPTPGPFNFSRINNIAARAAKGELLAFVNNDIKIRNGDWLAEMVSHFARPDVTAVGAKLYYGDGTLQHAGVVVGVGGVNGVGGVAGHFCKYFPGDAAGPFCLLKLPRETTAVTAACMVTRRSAFEAVGGFDETNLAVAFNDVDLCLKLRRAGGRIIWTPYAELDHFESVSRGSDVDPVRQARFQREVHHMLAYWGETLEQDPYYSPNLTLRTEDASLAFPPRVKRPWAS